MSWKTQVNPPTGFVLLTIRRPGPASFTMPILFALPDDRELLEETIDAEYLGITPFPIEGDGTFDHTRAILFRSPGDPHGVVGRVIAQVDAWQT
jgi:hypothetical protein